MPDDKEEKGRQYRQLFEASSIAWVFPIAIGLGYGWGYLMDLWFGTRPWLTWIFTIFGIIAAFINLFRMGLKGDGGDGSNPS
jgi:ATP synthase protein I